MGCYTNVHQYSGERFTKEEILDMLDDYIDDMIEDLNGTRHTEELQFYLDCKYDPDNVSFVDLVEVYSDKVDRYDHSDNWHFLTDDGEKIIDSDIEFPYRIRCYLEDFVAHNHEELMEGVRLAIAKNGIDCIYVYPKDESEKGLTEMELIEKQSKEFFEKYKDIKFYITIG